MAEKLNVTRKQALENAIRLVKASDITDDTEKVLTNMLTQISKPRAAVESKSHRANVALAKKVIAQMPAEGMTTKDIVNLGIPEIMSTQKASAVMRVACEMGIAEKVVDKKKVSYRPIAE